MIARTQRARRLSVSPLALSAMALTSSSPAYAAQGDVTVTNTETVQIHTGPDGSVTSQRVYEQLNLSGTGEVDLTNPVSDQGLRNLNGFGGFSVEDGEQSVATQVDGDMELRSVSDYEGSLPLALSVSYTLDGEAVDASDVVGRSGELEVSYTIENISGVPTEVTFDDARGGTITKTIDVPVPMVGSLTTVAPSTFKDVQSKQANMAGDGKGGTRLSFTVTLIPPIGSTSATFGYTAQIEDGVVPRADLTALPVNPLTSPSFASAATSYQGGADTGIELTSGAVEIDSNLLKLRDGAGDLLAGLVQLSDGADQLSEGLVQDAAPGSRELATGAGDLAEGLGKLDDGSGKLADGTATLRNGARDLNTGAAKLDDGAGKLSTGAGELSNGTKKALNGSKDLTSGLKKISDGLGSLGDKTQGLPAAAAGIDALKVGVDAINAGLGDPTQPRSLIGGLTGLTAGLGDAKTGAGTIAGGLAQLRGGPTSGLNAAKGGVDQVQSGLAESSRDGGSLDQLSGVIGSLRQFCDTDEQPTCGGTINALQSRVSGSKTSLEEASAGLQQVSGGLATAIGGLNTQLIPGAETLATRLGGAQAGASALTDGAKAAKGGIVQVRAGLDSLSKGVTAAVAGVLQLSTGATSAFDGSTTLTNGLGDINGGAGQLASGAGDLRDGTGQLRDGTGKLSSGSGELADGAGELNAGTGTARNGSVKLADGADQLAAGLGTAADGSEQLADGLDEAAGGAPELVDGATRLSAEGTSQLVVAGEATAQNYGELYATLAAGSERAQTEDMAFGAPEGAQGLTAYSYVIQGEDGEGGRNLTRGLAALVLLGAGAGLVALRRRTA